MRGNTFFPMWTDNCSSTTTSYWYKVSSSVHLSSKQAEYVGPLTNTSIQLITHHALPEQHYYLNKAGDILHSLFLKYSLFTYPVLSFPYKAANFWDEKKKALPNSPLHPLYLALSWLSNTLQFYSDFHPYRWELPASISRIFIFRFSQKEKAYLSSTSPPKQVQCF